MAEPLREHVPLQLPLVCPPLEPRAQRPLQFGQPFADSSIIPTHKVCQLISNYVTVAISGDGADELFMGYDKYRKKNNFESTVFRNTDLSFISEKPNTTATEVVRKIIPDFESLEGLEKIRAFDARIFLEGDILQKVDRLSMESSLEVRSPFLDHRVVEKAWSIPLNMKVSGGEGKIILKELLYKYVPKKLLDRPKMGFGIPLAEWLRGSLNNWAEDLLYSSKIKGSDFFEEKKIDKLWKEHLSKNKNCHYQLWPIIMFKAWSEKNG